MGALHEFGTALMVGGQTFIHGTDYASVLTMYICKKTTDGGINGSDENVEDQDGKRLTTEIYDLHKKVTLNWICKLPATPEAHFPDKQMCTLAGLTDWRVLSYSRDKTRSPNEITVEMEKQNFA
jgi:hypothetical protein